MRTAVVTVVAGRHEHLRAQRRHLAACDPPPDLHVVVAIDDPGVAGVCAEQGDLPTQVIAHPGAVAGLPVAAARNAGAQAAVEHGADLLVFLDVDCVPGTALLLRMSDALARHPGAVVSGPVTYLPPADPSSWRADALPAARRPHAARPDPPGTDTAVLAPELFWSLCFAVCADTWRALGGFYEGFLGYGAEDTDFGVRAAADGTALLMAGGADAYHLHHPVSVPPVEHLDAILRNAAVFARRHGYPPMRGWLAAFADAGLTEPGALRRVDAVRLVSIPPRHAYVDAITPPTVRRVEPDRVQQWAPDPLFHPDELRRHHIDVVHLHFGYEHLTLEQLGAWLRALADAGLPLVLTVHDLRNPHLAQPDRHDELLELAVRAATEVLTLTGAAAEEIARRFGRTAHVVAHPPLADPVPVPDGPRRHVLVPLKALRANVLDPVPLVAAVRDGAQRTGLRTRVLVDPRVEADPRLHGLADLDVDLDVTPYLVHDELCARVAAARAVVLPYRFGTHSGWVELARDLGTRVVAPDCGAFADQWADVLTYVNNERDGLDPCSLAAAVEAAGRRPAPPVRTADEREALGDQVMAWHDALYRRVAHR